MANDVHIQNAARRGITVSLGRLLLLGVALLSAVLCGCTSGRPQPTVADFQGVVMTHRLPQAPGFVQDPDAPRGPAEMGAAQGDPPGGAVAVTPTRSSQPAPRFEVIAQRDSDRSDEALSYYVEIDPVDLSHDGFKSAVKQVIDTLAANNGGPVFSASVFDNRPAAQTEVSYRTNPDLFSQDMIDAREAFNDRHLVATYAGGLAAPTQPPSFLLFWFPEAGPTQAAVSSWASAEVWEP